MRRVAMAVTLVGLGAIALDSAGWWWLSGRVAAQFGAWQAAQVAAGYQVSAGPAHRVGWPLQAAVTLPDVTIAAAAGASWHTRALRLVFEPWRPGVFTAIPTGPQFLRLGTAPLIQAAGRIEAVIPLDAAAITVEAHGLTVTTEGRSASAERVSARMASTGLELAANSVTLPKPAPGQNPLPLDGVVHSLRLDAQSNVPIPPAATWPGAAAAWQRAGGQLAVSNVDLQWGPLQARGSATLHLTAALQPEGAGSVQLTGFAAAVGVLQRSGTITQDAAQAAGAVLALLSTQQPGQAPEVDLPLTLRDGLVSAGPLPVLRVPNFIADQRAKPGPEPK